MEVDAGAVEDGGDDVVDEVADVGGRCGAKVFDPVGVLGADHGAAYAEAFEACRFDMNGRRDTVACPEDAAGRGPGEGLLFFALEEVATGLFTNGRLIARLG